MKVGHHLTQLFTTYFNYFFVILFSLFSFTSRFAMASEVPMVSLKSAIQAAREKNPSLLENVEKIKQLNSAIPQARALVLPQLTLTGQEQNLKGAVSLGNAPFGGSSYNLYKMDLKLTQPLFQYGTFSAIESTKKDVKIQALQTEITERDLIKSVILAYYNVVLSSYNVDTLVRQQKVVKETLATAEKRERSGRGQLLDVLQVKTEIALLQSQIETERNQLQISVATLENLMGEKLITDIQIKESLNAPAVEAIEQFLKLKEFRLPELEKNEVGLAQLEDQKSVLLGQHLPSLNFTGDLMYTSYSRAELMEDLSRSYSVGLQLTIPLFSGLSSIYQRQSINSQQIQLQLARTRLLNKATLEQMTSRKNLESARDSIVSGENALKLAQASIDEARKKYIFGTIDFLQFLQVEKSFIQAQFSLYSYKYNYINALTNYFTAWGQDLNLLTEILEKDNPS